MEFSYISRNFMFDGISPTHGFILVENAAH